jgi:hypothetical protein
MAHVPLRNRSRAAVYSKPVRDVAVVLCVEDGGGGIFDGLEPYFLVLQVERARADDADGGNGLGERHLHDQTYRDWNG